MIWLSGGGCQDKRILSLRLGPDADTTVLVKSKGSSSIHLIMPRLALCRLWLVVVVKNQGFNIIGVEVERFVGVGKLIFFIEFKRGDAAALRRRDSGGGLAPVGTAGCHGDGKLTI